MAATRRDIAPFLQRVRAFLLGREHALSLRFKDDLAARTQPPPVIPEGPSHLYSANYYYYCSRDGRGEVSPPIDLVKQQKLLRGTAEGSKEGGKLPTPGKVYTWD